MAKPNLVELIFFFVLFAAAGFLSFAVMSPYFTAIFLASVLTILFAPIHKRLLKFVHGDKNVAAILTVIAALFLILLPLIFFGILMFQEIGSIYVALSIDNTGLTFVNQSIATIESSLSKFIPHFQLGPSIYGYAENFLAYLASHLDTVFSGILSLLLEIILILVAMFFFYRDGSKLHEFIVKWSPLSDNYDESIIEKLEIAVASVVKGVLATAILQGFFAGLGFAIFGVPNPVLWGVVATIAALLPLVGTASVWIPAIVFLLFVHHTGAALGLFIWSVIFVSLIDNVINPMIIRRGVDIHPFVIFLSVLGGLAYFGPIGFLAGPIIIAFFFALLDIYPAIVKGKSIPDGTP